MILLLQLMMKPTPAYGQAKGKAFEVKQQCIGFTASGRRCEAWTNGTLTRHGRLFLCPKHRPKTR